MLNLLALALLQSFSLGGPEAPPASPAISLGLRPAVVEVVIGPPLSAETQLANAAPLEVTAAEYPRAWPRELQNRATGRHDGARYLWGGIGRFPTVDPVVALTQTVIDPQQWNRFAHARNNPLRFRDPDGRFIETGRDLYFAAKDLWNFRNDFLGGRPVAAAVHAVAFTLDSLAVAFPLVPALAGPGLDLAKNVGTLIRRGDGFKSLLNRPVPKRPAPPPSDPSRFSRVLPTDESFRHTLQELWETLNKLRMEIGKLGVGPPQGR